MPTKMLSQLLPVLIVILAIALCSLQHAPTPAIATALVGQVSRAANSDAYTLKLSLGTPPQAQLLPLDVEGAVTRVRCGLGRGAFDTASSTTFRQRLAKCRPEAAATCGLADDTATLNTTDGARPVKPYGVKGVQFRCLRWAAAGAPAAAMGGGAYALPAQLQSLSGGNVQARRFAYCLPGPAGVPGPAFFGRVDSYTLQSGVAINVSGILAGPGTSLSTSSLDGTYSVALKSMVVNGKTRISAPLFLRISTARPYTAFEHSTYITLRDTFRRAIGYGSVTPSSPPVRPFDTCFNASHFVPTRVGPSVPPIELYFRDGAIWTIFGWNSVVPVRDGSDFCLAFVDAGVGQPSVLGNFQQRDNFLEFDVPRSRLRFSGVLAFFRTLCADFLF